MKRYSGQKALYEAMKRSGSPRKRAGLLERLTPQLERVGKLARSVVEFRPKLKIRRRDAGAEKPAPPPVLRPPKAVERRESPVKPNRAQMLLKPKAVQFNAGRIEISLPWQLGVIIGLLVIVAILVVYQLGQLDERARYRPNDTSQANAGFEPVGPEASPQSGQGRSTAPSGDRRVQPQGGTTASATGRESDHVIVLAQFPRREDLVPVKEFFEQNGISMRIHSFATLRAYFRNKEHLNASVVPKGDGFMLTTAHRCENPEVPGTDGYAVKQKIIELGAQYEAPRGFESFARHHFSDAYGMKIE